MASKQGQRKRKSAGVCDIFEVNEKDLSPEPPDLIEGEPKHKVQKTTQPDVSEPEKVPNSRKTDPVDDRLDNDTTTNSIQQVCSFESNSSCVIVLDDSMPSQSSCDVINLEDSDLDPDVVIVSDDKVHSLEINDNETEMANVEHSIIIEKVLDVNTKLQDQCEVVSVSQNSISSDIDCTDNAVGSKEIITIHSESTNDKLEDGEVAEPEMDCDKPEPIITIHFRDSTISDIYKVKLLKVLQQFVELNPKDNGDVINIFRDEALDPKEWVVLDGTVCINDHSDVEELAKCLPSTPKPNSPKKKKKRKKSVSDLFVVDTQPAHTHNIQEPPTKYSAKFSIDDEKERNKSDPNKPSFSTMCFNCEQEHSLKDCPFPKNFAKINANRQKHQNNKSKSSRYHLEEDQKFSHLQPGKPSAALRKALGLRKHQVPGYVYRMRMLGYPPGWLEEAQYVKSDLDMFDIDGNSVRNTSAKKIQGLNPEKVIDYCGFNVPLGKGFKDEYKYYRVPPFSDHFRKENMIDVFNKMAERQQDDFEILDMDLGNSDLLPDVTNESETKITEFVVDSDSNDPISLLELENRKNTLLEEIKKAGETIPWECSDSKDTLTESNVLDDSPNNATLDTSQTEETKPKESDVIGQEEEVNEEESTLKTTSVKCSVFGTPIIKSCSPYQSLPNPDNFMKGVSPVIDFENLPNSTGKYEQMTGVLQKVRNTLKGLQKSDT